MKLQGFGHNKQAYFAVLRVEPERWRLLKQTPLKQTEGSVPVYRR